MGRKISRRQTLKLAGGAAVTVALSPMLACSSVSKSGQQAFDYIIVGAGSAGCVLAARLSENPNTRVLLLEAGPLSDDPLIDDPKNWFRLTFGKYVWPDKGTPQANANGKELSAVHGKLVGGSSAINAMIHHWPTPGDIDDWKLPNWKWDNLLPMLKRSETWLDATSSNQSSEFSLKRGDNGPIKVMRLPDAPPLADAALAAADRLGYGTSKDLNGSQQVGAGLNQLAYDGSKRQHTGYAYLAPALERPNLFIETNAQVSELLFDQDRCVGLNYRVANEMRQAEAANVILSAGALRSPAILMHSGIGPAKHLTSLDIPVRIAAEQVGENLHDHILVAGHNYATKTKIEESAVHGSVAIVYAASEYSGGARDLMLNVSSNSRVFPPLQSSEHGFKTSFSFTKPKSRGHLRLASADPFEQPLIDHNMLSAPDDLNGAIAALNLSRNILGASEFKHFAGLELNQELLQTREGMRQLIISGATTFGHHCGTCRMGTDKDAVVDENLRVRGSTGLYVIDASVIPEIPSCPTNALVVAMAEAAAKRLMV